MTIVAERPASSQTVEARPRFGRRLWGGPVWAHLAALAAILVALVPVIGTSSSFLADEGAAVIQAQSLSDGGGWVVEHPAPELDPDGHNYPIVHSESGVNGHAPLGKHPLYPVLLAAADRFGGIAGMVLLSVFGTVAAAGLAAALARRFDDGLARPTVWVVGLASPLLFDSFLIIGHTLGAALATGAVLSAVVAIERRSVRVALAVVPFVAGAVLLRNEAILFAVALASVAGLFALRGRTRWPAITVAAGAIAATGAARVAEKAWIADFVGRSTRAAALPVPVATQNLVEGRMDGFLLTWLTPSYGQKSVLVLSLLTMLGALAVAAYLTRRPAGGPGHGPHGVAVATVVAAGASLLALLTAPANIVPGLLVAFPLAAAGLFVMRRDTLTATAPIVAGAVFALFALAVIATQYSVGGTGEWGGRYFALGIPTLVPLLLLALSRQRSVLDARTFRVAAASLAVCSVAMSGMAVWALRAQHQAGDRVVAAIQEMSAGRSATRIVVTTSDGAPRLLWPAMNDNRWLLVSPAQLPDLRKRLATAGLNEFVFVTTNLERDRPLLDGLDLTVTPGSQSDVTGHVVLLVREI